MEKYCYDTRNAMKITEEMDVERQYQKSSRNFQQKSIVKNNNIDEFIHLLHSRVSWVDSKAWKVAKFFLYNFDTYR